MANFSACPVNELEEPSEVSKGEVFGEAKEHVTLIVPGNSFCEFVLRLASEFQKENLAKEVRERAREGAEVRPLFGKE